MTAQPNIVLDYYIGNTHIKFADNYCANKTEEDVNKALRDIARKVQRCLSANAVMNANEQNKG